MSDKQVRELERQLRKDPANLALRLQLAALYHEVGRTAEAIVQYREVVKAHRADGQVQQAIAVARTALAIAPDDAELRRLAGDSGPVTGSGPAARPSIGTVRVLDAAIAVRELEPMRPARGSGPVDLTPGGTPGGGFYTPTPLPRPIAYHDADPSKIRGGGEEDPTRDGGDGDTLPDGPTSGLSAAARRISERLIALSPPLEGEDLASELDTRRLTRMDPRKLDHLGVPPTTGQIARLEPEPDDEPTNPPASEPGFEHGRIQRTVGRLDDDAWIEEPTDPRDAIGGDRPSGVFDSPLGATIAALAPDGSPITEPVGLGSAHEAVRARLVGAGDARLVAAGSVIVREGDPGESLYLIDAGEIRVVKRAGLRAPVEVARLGPGAIIGEIAVMTDRRRHATVEAVGEVRLVEIGRAAVAAAAGEHVALAELLDSLVRKRLLSNLLLIAPFFAPLAPDRRPGVLARFRPRKVAAGSAVIEQGRAAQGLFLVLLGALDVNVRRRDGRTIRVATIGEGSHIGELALMADGPEPATVTAVGPAEVVMLPAREFYAVVAEDPELWSALRAEAARRTNEITAALR